MLAPKIKHSGAQLHWLIIKVVILFTDIFYLKFLSWLSLNWTLKLKNYINLPSESKHVMSTNREVSKQFIIMSIIATTA